MEHTMNTGDECWLMDGRKAFWAGEVDGQKLVRIAISESDPEWGYEEYPSDKLTPVEKVLKSEPADVLGPMTEQANIELEAVRKEQRELQGDIRKKKAELDKLEEAIAKYPDLSTALEFLDGRITHVVEDPEWRTPKIVELSEFLDDKFNGMRLVALFGTDRFGNTKWKRNKYNDGSGPEIEFEPFVGLDSAQNRVRSIFAERLDRWRKTGQRPGYAYEVSEAYDFIECPPDLADEIAALRKKKTDEKIAKLESEMAELRSE